MKRFLVLLLALSSSTSFADDRSCTVVFGQRTCADVEQIHKTVYIRNIVPELLADKAIAKKLCQATGLDLAWTKVKLRSRKSASGERVLTQVSCRKKLMSGARGADVGDVINL